MENQTETHAQTHEEWARETIEKRRALAYADPETGSDRYFLESMRMQQMGLPGWEEIKDLGIARYLEIQAENPYPEI